MYAYAAFVSIDRKSIGENSPSLLACVDSPRPGTIARLALSPSALGKATSEWLLDLGTQLPLHLNSN